MGYTKWALLRTAGNLAGNYAYYAERKRQLVDEANQFVNLAHSQSGGGSEKILRDYALAKYGPSDSVWEEKCRSGLMTTKKLLSQLATISWNPGNLNRFLELLTFSHHLYEDDELQGHINRFDIIVQPPEKGAQLLCDCLEIGLNICQNRNDEVLAGLPAWNDWFEKNVVDQPAIGWAIAKAKIGRPDGSDVGLRTNLEFRLPSVCSDGGSGNVQLRVTNCVDCGGIVSLKAMQCPHCGSPEFI